MRPSTKLSLLASGWQRHSEFPQVRCDSLLVVSQVNREYAVKDDRMVEFLQIILNLKSKFSLLLQTGSLVGKNHADSLASCTPSYLTTKRTSPAEKWLHSMPSTRSSTDFLRLTTYKATTKPRLATAPSLIACARAPVRWNTNRSKSFQACSGHTGPPSTSLHERLHFH